MFYEEEIKCTADVSIGQVLCKEKDKLIYEYDFGDSWEHGILLKKNLNPDGVKNDPACTGGKRACPPEDCGGSGGYYRPLDILKHPKGAKFKEMED
ncbi:MAG: plasmid pRiA4b ORF-3 family protein [Pontiellaceae bacterium]|jgi:hypothetical protein|nr:plasmid pRiA4b ORF-3 family protein [Pontiellaceae bacterium]